MSNPWSNNTKEPTHLTYGCVVHRWTGAGWIYCLSMILILFCIRNTMVLSDMWATYDRADLPESMTIGNFAYDILGGIWRGWNCYLGALEGHTGWAIIPSLVALPLYVIFGNSLLTLCQVPILYSAAIICMMYRLCIKYFDRTVATIAVAFYVFLPRHIQEWAIYPYCDLLEASFYSLLGLSLFLKSYELYREDSGKKRQQILTVVLFGLFSGVGIFHSDVYLFILGSIFVVCLFHMPKFLLRRNFIFLFLPALCIGLVPYFLFSPMISLSHVSEWIARKFMFAEAYKTPYDYWHWHQVFPDAIASLFWPVRFLSLGLLGGVPLLLIGSVIGINAHRGFRCRGSKGDGIFLLNIVRLFAFSYILVTINSALFFESYVFPAVAYLCILFALAVRDLMYVVRNTKMFVLQIGLLLIVVLCCGNNCFQVFKDVSLKTWGAELQKLATIKGCNFYWPFGYHPPAGYKTPLTKAVEDFGKIRFDILPNPHRTSVTDVEGVSYPIKKICLNHKTDRTAFLPLHAGRFLIYGIDVTFVGLESLAKEIQNQGFSEEAKKLAFMGLAAYYNSDHWISFLLDGYKNKDVEKVVPEPYKRVFYQEFGRRLRSHYGANTEKARLLIADLTDEQKSSIMAGFQMANEYVPARPFNRKVGL